MNLIDRAVRLWNYRQAYDKERVWVVTKTFKLIPLLSSGTPTSVQFNWRMVYTIWDNERFFWGFYHLHPPQLGKPRPSVTDLQTMRAWDKCYGMPLTYWIDGGWAVAAWTIESGALMENDPYPYDHSKIPDIGAVVLS